MIRLLVIFIFVLIVFIIVFLAMGKIIANRNEKRFNFNNLEDLLDVTELPFCPNGGKYVPDLGMIVDTTPVVATLACLHAPDEQSFNLCESLVIPQADDILANPIAFDRSSGETVLLFAQRVADSCPV